MKQHINTTLKALIIIGLTSLYSCKKDPDPVYTGYTVPGTYNFSNVNYSGQATRINMLTEMTTYMKTGNTQGTVLDANLLKNMFSNTGSPFSDTALNNSGKQLKNKCFLPDQPLMETYMDSIAAASQSAVAGANGIPGVVVSTTDNTKKYLFSANGIEYTQIIEKTMMGAVFFYQALNTYISPSGVGAGVDNTTVLVGEGTAMEHHWDEGFGYFGAPVDFPTNLSGLVYWAKYSNTVDVLLNTNDRLMNAFLKGRAAISNEDYIRRDEMISEIRAAWELVLVGTAIHYINEAISDVADDALRNHALSEGYAFVFSLRYHPAKLISTSDLNTVLGYFGTNFYNISLVNLNSAKNLLSTVYNLDSVKDAL